VETPDSGVSASVLMRTGKSAWGETDFELIDRGKAVKDENDYVGPVPLAAIATRKPSPLHPTASAGGAYEESLVVIGDSDFAANGSFHLSGNADFFLNVIDHLTQAKTLIAVRPKSGLGDRLLLTENQGRFIFLVSIVLLPLSVLGCGATVWLRRRRRG